MNEPFAAGDAKDPLSGPLLRQIGTHLRLAREERGQSLAEVAAVLRIRRTYLQNLEDGELAEIPGRIYALGFLRTYADFLEFDGEAIVDEVKRANEELPENPQLHVREPLPESQRPPLMLVGASVLLAALVYAGWTYWQAHDGDQLNVAQSIVGPAPETLEPTAAVAPTEERPAPVVPDLPALPAIPTPPPESVDDLSAETAETTPPDIDPAAAEATVDAIIERAEPTPEPAAAPDTAEPSLPAPETLLALIETESGGTSPQPYGDASGSSRIVLVATAPTWVRVRSGDEDFEWTRTMEQGDAFFVPNRDDLALWTGNAGGLKIILDGEAQPALGQSGEVRRDIPLAVDSLRAQYADD